MFLSSLPTWLWILAALVIFCPLAGKQIAKDALRIKDSFEFSEFTAFWLFPLSYFSGEKQPHSDCPIIKKFTETQYIKRMMIGGVLVKLLLNFLMLIIIVLIGVVGLLIYSGIALFRGIFSAK